MMQGLMKDCNRPGLGSNSQLKTMAATLSPDCNRPGLGSNSQQKNHDSKSEDYCNRPGLGSNSQLCIINFIQHVIVTDLGLEATHNLGVY
tara:strand:- start:650 stop:919 length:270 start_codon:yes stop_codon:yes gene_type:complete